jgi:catechol-2,3-dioxygenase
MIKINRVFTSYSVKDLGEAKKFYQQTLGLNVSENPMGILELNVNNGNQVWLYPKPDHQPATYTVLNFIVDDLDETVAKLNESGIKLEQYHTQYIQTDERGVFSDEQGPRIGWFKDPSGNIVSVIDRRDREKKSK